MPCHKTSGSNLRNDFLIITAILFSSLTNNSVAGPGNLPDTLYNRVMNEKIHTVLLRSASWELSLPVYYLGSNQQLELRFDDLSGEKRTYGYTLIHCDAGWKKTSHAPQEYLSGYGQGTITESETSFNTTYDFVHYHLTFPVEDCLPLISGNYAVVVFDENNPDDIILIRRFYVSEQAAQISGTVRRPGSGLYYESGQQVLFSVKYNNDEIHDPLNEIYVAVMQNGRYDNSLIMKKPFTVQKGLLEYTDQDRGIFMGGNEFRSLDIKSMKYQTENMDAIEFRNPYFHVIMKPDESRAGKPYFNRTDLNGSYFIDKEKAGNKYTEADYVYVHFNLVDPALYTNDEVYVTGGFCDWINNAGNKMKYNTDKGCFELTLLMKQGLYDYCFAKMDAETGRIDEYELEGSHYETVNDYYIFVYFHDSQKGYDRLLGFLPIK